jgi:L-threonylcarbamoyladenylate synthase
VKNRPSFDPLIVHLSTFADAWMYASSIPEWAFQLASRFMPGPLTVVLPKAAIIPDIVTSGLDTVALRVPSHPLAHALLSQLDFPLAAPSANPFGYISPVTARHVHDQLGGKIAYILDGGTAAVGLESTIVAEVNAQPTVLRLGGISLESIREVLPGIGLQAVASTPLAPGQLESHYAPNTRLYFDADERMGEVEPSKIRTIRFSSYVEGIPHTAQRILSPKRDLHEAARNLFAVMRELDADGDVVIFAERFPEEGLGRAINDRLQRASIKR